MPLSPRLQWKLDRFREKLAAFFGGAKETDHGARPRLCPACGQLVGSTATTCHNCGANLRFSLAAASRSLSRFLPESSPATYGILIFTIFLYGVSLFASVRSGASVFGGGFFDIGAISGAVLARLGASFPLPGDIAQPWRLVTAVFLHGGLLHIGCNMWVLMDVGPIVEEAYGSARFLFIYVMTGIAGFALSSFSGHFSVGASGALLGLIGLMLALTWGRRSMAMQTLRSGLIRWLIYIGIFGLIMPGIDNMGHLGGLLAGFFLGRVMAPRPPADAVEVKRAQVLGWTAAAVIVASFAGMVLAYLHGGV